MSFGSTNPREMPTHLFSGAIHLDYGSAIRGDPQKQNYSICPRYWYIDADFECRQCRKEFTWSAREQKEWFEVYHFWIDSSPRLCKQCMANRRHLENLRKEYDSIVAEAQLASAVEHKLRVIEIVRELESAFTPLPAKMIQTRDLFQRQLAKK